MSGGNNEIAKDVAMHVTAQKPQVVAKEDLDPADIDREREILSVAARGEGKPENIIAKMVEGRLRNFYSETGAAGTAVRQRRQADGRADGKEGRDDDQAVRALGVGEVRRSRVRAEGQETARSADDAWKSLAVSRVNLAAGCCTWPPRKFSRPAYRRVVLKLSGESFCHAGERGISMTEVVHIARQTVQAAKRGVQIAIVMGGGNILRGAQFTAGNSSIQEATAHYMGMLATVINGLALQDALESLGCQTAC